MKASRFDVSKAVVIGKAREGTSPAFVVWGDSHALAFYEPMLTVAQSRGVHGLLISRPSCPPMLGVRRYASDDDALAWNEDVMTLIEQQQIRNVVLVARWSTGLDASVAGGTRQVFFQKAGQDRAAVYADQAMKDGLNRTINRLCDQGVNVFVLPEVPAFAGDDTKPLFVRKAWGMLKNEDDAWLNTVGPTLEEHERFQAQVQAVFAQLDDGAQFPDPAPYCFGSHDHAPLGTTTTSYYADNHHLSIVGSRILLTDFAEALFDQFVLRDDPSTASAVGTPQD